MKRGKNKQSSGVFQVTKSPSPPENGSVTKDMLERASLLSGQLMTPRPGSADYGIVSLMNNVATLSAENHRKVDGQNPLKSAGWNMVKGGTGIYKEFIFRNFNEAWGFMNRLALEAERLSHYPELLNMYNKVRVTLLYHHVNGLSPRDVQMASFLESIASPVLSHR